MPAKPRSAPWLCVASALCLTACQTFSRPSTPPTPSRVSDCIEEPEGIYPDPPAFPEAGQAITDRFLVELASWNNQVLGIATTDRIRWRSERKCLSKMVEAGVGAVACKDEQGSQS